MLLTAPGAELPNVIFGVNHEKYDWTQVRMASAGSCTTNAVTPILLAIESTFGIARAHVNALHAYTSDQNLLDNFHHKPRRGRSASLNMILTSTGAAAAVSQAIPASSAR